jgi:hypothetical protein
VSEDEGLTVMLPRERADELVPADRADEAIEALCVLRW